MQRPFAFSGLLRPALSLLAALASPVAVYADEVRQAVPLATYGRLPSVEQVALSPDGSHLAFVATRQDRRILTVFAIADNKTIKRIDVGENKLRSLTWADNDHMMVFTSQTGMPWGLSGEDVEWSHLQVISVATGKIQVVPDPKRLADDAHPLNALSGEVMVRQVDGHTVLYVPGLYVTNHVVPMLVRADLDTERQKVEAYGSTGDDWLVDASGNIAAKMSYDSSSQQWQLQAKVDGKFKMVDSGKAAIDPPRLVGFAPAADTLLIAMHDKQVEHIEWKHVSLQDGAITPAPEAEGFVEPFEDAITHRMAGATFTDSNGVDHYDFIDAARQRRWDAVVKAYGGDRVRLVSESADFKKLVVLVDGPQNGLQYQLVDFDKHGTVSVGDVYEGIVEPLPVRRIDYQAADGFKVPAYLTLPPGANTAKLPLVVLPHGGPAASDTADFDWWSQALAEQGYAVLRPNYRGSTTTPAILEAGYGEFGRKMQSDLSDGVRFLAKEGIIDPARVCIVGASYGGYAALAGATLDAGVYRCAVSVAGLSDLKRFLRYIERKHGNEDSSAQRFWDRFMGVSGL
ncbi:MAG: S9 family peptidase, partial [Burkholderiales bacterium]|nr:S9 family peptidase [Burkholderiales bacterium]